MRAYRGPHPPLCVLVGCGRAGEGRPGAALHGPHAGLAGGDDRLPAPGRHSGALRYPGDGRGSRASGRTQRRCRRDLRPPLCRPLRRPRLTPACSCCARRRRRMDRFRGGRERAGPRYPGCTHGRGRPGTDVFHLRFLRAAQGGGARGARCLRALDAAVAPVGHGAGRRDLDDQRYRLDAGGQLPPVRCMDEWRSGAAARESPRARSAPGYPREARRHDLRRSDHGAAPDPCGRAQAPAAEAALDAVGR